MHTLASEVGLKVWHGFELLAKLKQPRLLTMISCATSTMHWSATAI